MRSNVDICKSACARRREATFVYKLLIDSKQSHVTGTAGGRTGRVVGGDPKLPRTGTAYRKNLIHLKVFFCKLRNKFPFPLATSLASQGDENEGNCPPLDIFKIYFNLTIRLQRHTYL